MGLKYGEGFCHIYTENRRLMVSQWNFLFPLCSKYISLCEDITANFLVWPYRIVLFLSFLDALFTSTVDIFLIALCSHSLSEIYYYPAPFIFVKSGFISYRDPSDAVLSCELMLCVQMFMET